MIAVKMLVPQANNAGKEFTREHHKEFEARAIHLFGGFSRTPGDVGGGWAGDDGVVYTDSTHEYTVAVPAILGNSHELNQLVAFAKKHYDQLAIYVSYLGQAEVL